MIVKLEYLDFVHSVTYTHNDKNIRKDMLNHVAQRVIDMCVPCINHSCREVGLLGITQLLTSHIHHRKIDLEADFL